MAMIKYDQQTHSTDDNSIIIIVDEYLKFQEIPRDLEVIPAYRSGYWNCYLATDELVEHLRKHKIKYHLGTK